MKNKKYFVITIIIAIFLLAVFAFMFYKKNNEEKTMIKKFLNQYYTIDKIISPNFLTEDYLNNEIKEYTNLMEDKCLDKFVSSRVIMANKSYSSENQCTIYIDKLDIQHDGKTADGYSNYNFDIILKAKYNDNTQKTASITGKFQVSKINNKPIITYFSCSNLKFD
jgi:hypothetical protein